MFVSNTSWTWNFFLLTLKLFRNTLQAFLITLVFVNSFFKVNAWKLYSLSTAKWLGRYNDSTLGPKKHLKIGVYEPILLQNYTNIRIFLNLKKLGNSFFFLILISSAHFFISCVKFLSDMR